MKPTPGSLLSAAAALAVCYFAMVVLPVHVASGYETVAKLHPWAGKIYLVFTGSFFASLTGLLLWIGWRLSRGTRERARAERQAKTRPSDMAAAEREQEMARHLQSVEAVLEQSDPADASHLRRLRDELAAKREARRLEIAAVGTVSSGKSALLNALAGRKAFASDVRGGTTTALADTAWDAHEEVRLVDTPGLGEVGGEGHGDLALEAAKTSDLVLFVVDGPLKDHEHRVLELLRKVDKPVVLCLNKSDWITGDERARLLDQLRRQTAGLVPPEHVVAVRAEPAARVRARIGADGRETEESVEVPADLSDLARQLLRIVRQDGSDLLLCNLLLRTRMLSRDAEALVADARDARARSVVHAAMWKTGGFAAAAPVPFLDAILSTALLAAMARDLAAVYRQPFDLQSVIKLVEHLVKNLAVTLSIPAAASFLASAAKAVPGFGTLAGAAAQGAAQALFTRWLGLVLIEYYRSGLTLGGEALVNQARKTWAEIASEGSVRALIDQARALAGGEKKP